MALCFWSYDRYNQTRPGTISLKTAGRKDESKNYTGFSKKEKYLKILGSYCFLRRASKIFNVL